MKVPAGMLFPILLSATANADSVLRVVSETGAPLDNARVVLDGEPVAVNPDGRFELPADTGPIVQISVVAEGHYAFLHTIDRRDLEIAALAPIQLVARKPGRRLLVFAGDAMLTRRYLRPRGGEPVLVRPDTVAEDAARLLAPIKPYIELADLASVNLETTLADDPPGEPIQKSVVFYSPPALAGALEDAGFDYVALGNNHVNDFQEGGVRSTFDALAKTSLAFSGAGMNEAESRRPAIVDVAGQNFAYLSYVGWLGYFRPSQAAQGERSGATYGTAEVFSEDLGDLPAGMPSVLQHHSGLEYSEMPALTVRTELRHAIEAGADVAIGHHPHVLQGYEIYRDRLIAYSIGNFLFDQFYYTTQLGVLTYVWMDGERLHRAELVPVHVNGYLPTPATGSLRYAILHRIARLSAPFGTCLEPSGAHAVVRAGPDCETTTLRVDDASAAPMSLRRLGVSPLQSVSVAAQDRAFRLGTDILRRGEFDYVGLFGAAERGWLTGAGVSIGDSLAIRVPPGAAPVRTGMSMFHRSYKPSTPTTLTGRVRADAEVRLRVLLQRQRRDRGISEELENGPITELAVVDVVPGDWQSFDVSFHQPRVATQGVRILFEIDSLENEAAAAELDELAWIEWSTPWLDSGAGRGHATHVELR